MMNTLCISINTHNFLLNHQHSQDRYTKDEEWTLLLTTVQRKISFLNDNNENRGVYHFHIVLLKGTLKKISDSH